MIDDKENRRTVKLRHLLADSFTKITRKMLVNTFVDKTSGLVGLARREVSCKLASGHRGALMLLAFQICYILIYSFIFSVDWLKVLFLTTKPKADWIYSLYWQYWLKSKSKCAFMYILLLILIFTISQSIWCFKHLTVPVLENSLFLVF